MEPRLLLQWLLDRDGENSNSLAAKLKNATTQPQIHKYLSGKAKQPRHSTLEPIAKHYGIPIDALYNEDEADRVMSALITAPSPTITPTLSASNHALAQVQQAQLAINCVASLDQALDVLIAHLSQVDASKRAAVAAVMAALVHDPDDAGMRAALTSMLTPSGFAEQERKAA